MLMGEDINTIVVGSIIIVIIICFTTVVIKTRDNKRQ